MQLRLFMIGYTGPTGHLSPGSMKWTIRNSEFWSTMTAEIRPFGKWLISFPSTNRGKKVPRSFGPSGHRTTSKNLQQFDSIHIEKRKDGNNDFLLCVTATPTTISSSRSPIVLLKTLKMILSTDVRGLESQTDWFWMERQSFEKKQFVMIFEDSKLPPITAILSTYLGEMDLSIVRERSKYALLDRMF